MQCKEIQEMLSAYIDRALEEQEMLAVENHINACSICYQELAALQETVKLLQALGEVAPPEEFRGQLLVKLRALPTETSVGENATGTPKLNLMRRWFGGINKYLVAAVIMIGLGMGTGIHKLDTLTSAPKDTLEQIGTLEIARDIPREADGGTAGGTAGETTGASSEPYAITGVKTQDPVSAGASGQDGTEEKIQLKRSADTSGSESRTAQEPPEVAGLAADQAKPTAGSSAGNSEQSPAKSREQSLAGSGVGSTGGNSAAPPGPDTATESHAVATEKPAVVAGAPAVTETPAAAADKTAAAPDIPAGAAKSREIAAESLPAAESPSAAGSTAGAAKSATDAARSMDSQASKVSGGMAGWIFPVVMLAGGIVCAGYYIRLRRNKP